MQYYNRYPKSYAERMQDAVFARIQQLTLELQKLQRNAHRPAVQMQIRAMKRELNSLWNKV